MYTAQESKIVFTARAKYIRQPDGSLRLAMIEESARPIFVPEGWERRESTTPASSSEEERRVSESDPDRSRRRALNRITELVSCNSLDYFATLTFSPEVVDRKNYAECEHLFSRWESNQVQRKGFKYVCIPEFHKDKSIHLHLLGEGNIKVTESGVLHHGKMVYNIPSWKAGFSTLQYITGESNEVKIAKYCTKYMTKDSQKIGGRWYLSGGKLNEYVYEYANSVEELQGDNVPVWSKDYEGDWGTYHKLSFI